MISMGSQGVCPRPKDTRTHVIYQMYAYLRSQVGQGEFLADHAEGLLLHPSIGKTLDETVVIQGHSKGLPLSTSQRPRTRLDCDFLKCVSHRSAETTNRPST